jgi:hypothetical protein
VLPRLLAALFRPQRDLPRPNGCIGRATHLIEVATQCFERVFLLIDFVGCTHATAAEKWHRRTPALKCMLQQESHHRRWECQQTPINKGTQ